MNGSIYCMNSNTRWSQTKSINEAVEGHLADLHDYFNWRLKGSDHYSSSRVSSWPTTSNEESDLLNKAGEPYEHLSDDEQLLT